MIDHALLVEATRKRLARTMATLAVSGVSTLDTAHGWALDPTSSGNTRSSEISDPTGNAAVNPGQQDKVWALYVSALDTLEDACKDVEKYAGMCELATGSAAHARYKQEYQAALTLANCASVLCEDQAPVGNRHCPDCTTYLDRHTDITQVPREVIQGRVRKRRHDERTRIHITGPLAEEEVA